VACGGGDRTVTVWEVESGKILYKLGGHKGSVGAVDWHPREPISESTAPRFRFVLCPHTAFRIDLTSTLSLLVFDAVLTGGKDGQMLLGEIDAEDRS
jgi:WD40 repeat protein